MLTRRQLCAYLAISGATEARMRADPDLQPPLPPGYMIGSSKQSVRYDVQEVDAWIAARKSLQDPEAVNARRAQMRHVRARRTQRERAGKDAPGAS
jgi:predicted DNA-binding transcriptional regulator AlpA